MPSLLYVGDLGPGLTSQDRADALASLGAEVDAIGPEPGRGIRGKIDWVMSSRLQVSRSIRRLNALLAEKLTARKYDILWLDKGWQIQPGTLAALRSRVSSIVLFNNDNPWGGHERGMWRLHRGIVPMIDEVMVPKYSVIRPYEKLGARRVSVVDFGYAPTRHFAPDKPVTKTQEICFIGTALKDGGGIRPPRTEIILELGKLLPGRISIYGHGWKKVLAGAERNFNIIADGAWDNAYRETIWKSRINLSFVTKDNWEESSHRAFEITACGGCLLAERSSRLEQSFAEGEEALYFQSAVDCAEIATRLLNDDARRERIAGAGHRRALGSGYDNRSRLAEAIARSPVLRDHFSQRNQFSTNAESGDGQAPFGARRPGDVMTSNDQHVADENPNMAVYRSYVSSGAFGTSVEGTPDLGPRLPYLKRLVRKFFPVDKASSILDLGCGDGGLLSVAQDSGYRQLTGVDLSSEQVQIARARGLADIRQAEIIPFLQQQAAATFDLVVTFDVIEHLTKKELMTAMGEVYRILKTGGRWIMHVPNGQSPFFGRIRYGDFTHELAFTQRSLASVLRVGGFSDIESFEDQPIPHGLTSFVRFILWKILRNLLRLYIMIESGERGGDLVFSQNFLAIADKRVS